MIRDLGIIVYPNGSQARIHKIICAGGFLGFYTITEVRGAK